MSCVLIKKKFTRAFFFTHETGSKWRKTSLTYFIEFGSDLPQSQQESIFRKALQYWADVSGLSFSRTYSPQGADIKIRYDIFF